MNGRPVTAAHRAIDAVWKREAGRIIAGLTRMVHDVGLAEESAQEALVAALEQWPASGVPDNPGAWLTAVARRRAIDQLRRSERLDRTRAQLAREADLPAEEGIDREGAEGADHEQDDVLRLMFISCHPVLPTQERVALTLRLLGGLTAGEIARAFLAGEPTIVRRIARAKRTLAEQRVPFELPSPSERAERLSSVLDVIYLIFNEGYSATSGDDLMRPALSGEALRLGRLLAELAPDEAEVHGLVALMEIQASRSATRTGPTGEPVQLHRQDRAHWDQALIRRGFTAMLRAREIGGVPGPYVLQAAIAVCHAQARTADATDWTQIATLYRALVRLLPTPVVRLNQAVAVGRADGPQAGLALVDGLGAEPAMLHYHLLPGVRGDLLLRLGRHEEARREFERAASLTRNAAERAFLRRRAGEIPADGAPAGTLGSAAERFLGREDLHPATVRSYRQTLRRLCLSLGDQLPLTLLTGEAVTGAATAAWGRASAATWNRHRAAVRSFCAWIAMAHLAEGLDRRAEPRAGTTPLRPADLDALCGRPDLSLRERTLWRLLHESAAPVATVLALDVQDLDLADRRGSARGRWVTWRSGTAGLLPDLLTGRTRGPVFLSDRRPAPARAPADGDLCPHTGRRRLSYERAEYLFKQATRSLDPAGNGFTLHQLKPGASAGATRRR